MNPPLGLTLHCLECNWQVQVAEGTPVSALRSDCLVCKANVGIRSEPPSLEHKNHDAVLDKDNQDTGEQSKNDVISTPFLPIYTTDERVLEGLVDPSNSDELFLIDSFVSRITPLVLAAQVVAELQRKTMEDNGQENDLETILDEFAEQGIALRNYIREHEENVLGIKGERASGRLSVGFPKDGSESLRFFINTFLGGEHGLAKKMGAIQDDGGEVMLTKAAVPLLDITVFDGIKDVKMKTHGRNLREVELPEWYTESDVKKILDFIQKRASNEIRWMQGILGQASLPGGRTPRNIMEWEYSKVSEKKSPRKWKHPADNESESDDDLFDDEFYKNDKLANEIKNTLKGTLNRMKELGLMYSFKKGRQTYYKPTNLGAHWIRRWDSEDN